MAQFSNKYLVLITKNGFLKKLDQKDFEQIRKSGLMAFSLKKNDQIVSIKKIDQGDEIILITSLGKIICFQEKEVKTMSRQAGGIKAIKLQKDDQIVNIQVRKKESKEEILIITENAFGKRADLKEIRRQKKGGQGMIISKINERTGKIAKTLLVDPSKKSLLIISKKGQVLKIPIISVPQLKRASQGVRLMKFSGEDKIGSISNFELNF